MLRSPPGSRWATAAGDDDTIVCAATASKVFLAASRRAPLLALLHGLERGEPLIVVSGDAGVGKTTLLASALPAGESGGTQRIWHRGKGDRQLTRARVLSEIVAQALPGDVPEILLAGQSAQCRRAILIIDDAHLLTPEAIDTLIGVLDTARAGSEQLQLVLVGRPMVWNRLRRAAAVDRVKVSGEMTGLSPDEAQEYLRERLQAIGAPPDDIRGEDIRSVLPSRGRWTLAELNAILAKAGDPPAGLVAGPTVGDRVASAVFGPGVITDAGSRLDAEPPAQLQGPASRRLRRVAAMAAALLAIVTAGAIYRSRNQPRADWTAAEPTVPKAAALAMAPASRPPAAVQQAEAPRAPAPSSPAPSPPAPSPPALAVPAAASQLPDHTDVASQRLALTMPAAQLDELFRRGEAMLARGDIVAARVLYRRAALANSGPAATILGKTYDPAFLAGIGATAAKPAPSSAAAWYSRAAELGDKEAQDRLLQLRSRASQVAGND